MYRQVSYEEGKALADQWNVPFQECSAKLKINVGKLFPGTFLHYSFCKLKKNVGKTILSALTA